MKSAHPLVMATHEYLPFRGGAAVYVREVAAAAQALGIGLEVWTADRHQEDAGGSSNDSFGAANKSSDDPPVVRFPSNGRLTPRGLWSLARGWWRRRELLRERSVLVMSVGAHMIFFWFDLLGVVSARRTLVVFYGSEVLRFARSPLWRWLARRYYARAGGFGACSNYTAAVVRGSGLLPDGAEIIVALCALPAVFANQPTPASTAESEDGTWRVLTVARLHPRKGQREVARALALLPDVWRAKVVYQTVGVGEESYRAEIEEACRTGGVRCEFLGRLDDRALADAYARCTLYAQASRTLARSVEGFGISFLEAAFFGKPAAAFRSGGVVEAVVDGRTAFLVPEDDLAGLAAAIARLLEDAALRTRMGEAGREYVRSLRWEDAARSLCEAAARLPAVRS